MTTAVAIDVDVLRDEITKTYPYARSTFEDTRRKAKKYGAMGSMIQATKPTAEAPDPDARG